MSKAPELKKVTLNNIADTGGVVNVAALLANPEAAATSENAPAEVAFTAVTPIVSSQAAPVQEVSAAPAPNAALIPQLNSNVAPVVVDTADNAYSNAKAFTNRNNPSAVAAASAAAAAARATATNVGANGNILRQSPSLARAQQAREDQKLAASELSDSLERILAQVPGANRSEIIRIRQYCVAMAPGRAISDEQGAQQQVALYRSLQTIINRQAAYFTPLFIAVLKIFQAEANGALADTHRNRFESHVTLSKEDRRAFRNITHLLSVVAEPKGRALALRTIDLETALANGLTEEGRNRVINHLT